MYLEPRTYKLALNRFRHPVFFLFLFLILAFCVDKVVLSHWRLRMIQSLKIEPVAWGGGLLPPENLHSDNPTQGDRLFYSLRT